MNNEPASSEESRWTNRRINYCILFGLVVLEACWYLISWSLPGTIVAALLAYFFVASWKFAWNDQRHQQSWRWYQQPIQWSATCLETLEKIGTNKFIGYLATTVLIILSLIVLVGTCTSYMLSGGFGP